MISTRKKNIFLKYVKHSLNSHIRQICQRTELLRKVRQKLKILNGIENLNAIENSNAIENFFQWG